MENMINQKIKDAFDDNIISSIIKCDFEFGIPVPSEEISNLENDNNITILDMYKSWLMLIKYARIMNAVVIDSIDGSGRELLFSDSTDEISSIDDDGEKEEYEDFADLLGHVYIKLEDDITIHNTHDAVLELKKTTDKIKQNNIDIETEEIEFDDVYQITIKIKKQEN